jgi:hypothetical protein
MMSEGLLASGIVDWNDLYVVVQELQTQLKEKRKEMKTIEKSCFFKYLEDHPEEKNIILSDDQMYEIDEKERVTYNEKCCRPFMTGDQFEEFERVNKKTNKRAGTKKRKLE